MSPGFGFRVSGFGFRVGVRSWDLEDLGRVTRCVCFVFRFFVWDVEVCMSDVWGHELGPPTRVAMIIIGFVVRGFPCRIWVCWKQKRGSGCCR